MTEVAGMGRVKRSLNERAVCGLIDRLDTFSRSILHDVVHVSCIASPTYVAAKKAIGRWPFVGPSPAMLQCPDSLQPSFSSHVKSRKDYARLGKTG